MGGEAVYELGCELVGVSQKRLTLGEGEGAWEYKRVFWAIREH